MVAKVSVKGGPETARAFDALAEDISNLQSTHEKVARARLDGVSRRTPTRTGALAASWSASGSGDTATISSDLDYAATIEYGSDVRNIEGAHMVGQTLEAEESQLLQEYEEAILALGKKRGFRIG